jgi:hypothetical protein
MAASVRRSYAFLVGCIGSNVPLFLTLILISSGRGDDPDEWKQIGADFQEVLVIDVRGPDHVVGVTEQGRAMYTTSIDSIAGWNQIGTGFKDISGVDSGANGFVVGVTDEGNVLRNEEPNEDGSWNQLGSGYQKASAYTFGVAAISGVKATN